MRRLTTTGFATLVILGFVGTPVASAQQQVSFSIGGFSPRGPDGRTLDDVLVNNLDFLAFNISDFGGPSFSLRSATTSTPASGSATTSDPCRRSTTTS
jgi:hypothetical protein